MHVLWGTDLPLHVGMAELVDALVLGTSVLATWRFKSSYRHLGELAQLVEHLLCTQGVSGSSPLFSINGLATSVLTSPREKRIGKPTHVREKWDPSRASPADEQGVFPILCSSAVEPSTVNRLVPGSNPGGGVSKTVSHDTVDNP